MDEPVRLPEEETIVVELDLDEDRLRAAGGEGAGDEQAFARYSVRLGAGRLEARSVIAAAGSPEEAYDRLHRLLGAVEGETAVTHFRYGHAARRYAEEQRAHAAHERMAGAHEALIEKLEAEIATREQRIANFEAALGR